MTETLRSMIADARGKISEVPPADAYEAQQSDDVHLVIDVREPHEFEDAHVRDSVNVPRGVLELRADPESPTTDATLSGDKSKRIVLYCTKSPGARSLLAAQTLQDMGYENVEVLGGGLDAWTEAGLPVDRSA
jgi:rhodanese-related sulfurtransferase